MRKSIWQKIYILIIVLICAVFIATDISAQSANNFCVKTEDLTITPRVIGCNAGYHIEGQTCVSNTGTGGYNWQGNAYNGIYALAPLPSGAVGALTVSITQPANNTYFAAPATITIKANAVDSTGGTITSVEFYNGANYLGMVTTGTAGVYTFSWQNVGLATYTLKAKAINNKMLSAYSLPINVVVSQNTPPTVRITGPATGSVFAEPANITIAATASDPNGTVVKVEFYANTTKLGEDTTAPYSFAWNNVLSGTYSLKAIATDNGGASTTSDLVVVKISKPPTVIITAPADWTQLHYTLASHSITIKASASDSDGTVVKVEFYASGAPLGVATTSPYTFDWSFSVNYFILTAKAIDNLGLITTSLPIYVAVDNPDSKARDGRLNLGDCRHLADQSPHDKYDVWLGDGSKKGPSGWITYSPPYNSGYLIIKSDLYTTSDGCGNQCYSFDTNHVNWAVKPICPVTNTGTCQIGSDKTFISCTLKGTGGAQYWHGIIKITP